MYHVVCDNCDDTDPPASPPIHRASAPPGSLPTFQDQATEDTDLPFLDIIPTRIYSDDTDPMMADETDPPTDDTPSEHALGHLRVDPPTSDSTTPTEPPPLHPEILATAPRPHSRTWTPTTFWIYCKRPSRHQMTQNIALALTHSRYAPWQDPRSSYPYLYALRAAN